ncbi:MAG: AsnC family transcriptional regulator [Bacteroidetes bacterium]|nr:AsnC family transcriptional regulator [Bacteroidota bacterium]
MQKYFFAPRGIAFAEPGIVALDNPKMSALNITKSSYQIRPEVFNLNWLSEATKVKKEELKKRLLRLYDEHLIILVLNGSVQVEGFGLYYWIVKLREGTSPKIKKEFGDWYQNKDEICSSWETEGDFDFFNGNHMRVLDNLIWNVIMPLGQRPEVEYVHLCPIRRDIREDWLNMPDAPGGMYRQYSWGEEEEKNLLKCQDKLDATDIKIIKAINQKRPMKDYFDFKVLAEISGLDPKDMEEGIKDLIESKRIVVPLIYMNWQKMGLTHKMYLIKLSQIIPSWRKAEIADELAAIPEFNLVLEFTDSFYDIAVRACNQTTNVEKLLEKIQSYTEVETVKQSNMVKQYRRWVDRLDDHNGFWEESIFTDDFLQDYTVRKEEK